MISPTLGTKHVHRPHGFVVVVDAHIESFDVLRVVCNDHRFLEKLLREKSLVLGLQINAPFHGKLPGFSRLLELLNRIGVGNVAEF